MMQHLCLQLRFITIGMMVLFIVLPVTSVVAEGASINQLDRLFTTRYERAQLDAMRRRDKLPEEDQSKTAQQQALPPVTVELKGYMKRADGPDVVWVNQKNTLENRKVDDQIRVRDRELTSDTVRILVNGRQVKLKPGQSWDQAKNEIRDSYEKQSRAATSSETTAAEEAPDE